jgi:peptide/nickel transport system substrate-binding protein
LVVGIRARVRTFEPGVFAVAAREKSFRYLVRMRSVPVGNAATCIDAFVFSEGAQAYGGYPDIDALHKEQSVEMDVKKREAILHRIQQLMHERVMFAPIIEAAIFHGVGPRVQESALGLIPGHPYSAPYEELRLK